MNINEKPVTAFDLEPNPFEQSFASTKKATLGGRLADKSVEQGGVAGVIPNGSVNGVSVGGAIPGGPSPGARQANAPLLDSKSRLLMNIGGAGAGAGQAPGQVAGGMGPGQAKPPNIQSPPILSPGGSRRLPPLTLSPNTAISNVLQGQTSPGAFYLNLPKTGLTPNESNIRSGLTPALMNSNGTGNGNNGTSAVANTNGLSAIPVALTSSTGLTPGRFSPMLNSLLNMPRGPVFPVANTNNNNNNNNNNAINNTNTNNTTNNSHSTNNNINMNNTNIDGRALTNQAKDDSIPNNKSPNSSPNNSNIMSVDSNTTQSAISNSASQLVLSSDITLGQVKNSDGMTRGVYNNDDPKSVAKHKGGTRTQSKKNGVNTEFDNKENVSSVNGTNNATASSSTSLKNKSGTKKRKVSTSKSKPKSSPNESDNFSEPTYDGGSDAGDTEADRARKRQEFLERNRIAASRFRKRKKEYIKRIEADLSFYESEYNDLTACLASLTGISPHNNNSMGNPSLINSLKQALITQDLKSALQLCDMLEHTVLNTKYIQRNGVNPRELSHRSEDMGESDA